MLTLLSWCFRALPRRVAHGLGAVLGWIWYYGIPIRRSLVKAHLRQAFPERSRAQIASLARASYVQLARCAVEFLRLPGLDRGRADALIEYRGLEHLERALSAGRGVIVATAHYGNFDLLACAQALRGLPLHVVTRVQSAAGVNRFWMRTRARTGLGLLPAKGSAMRIGKLLRAGQVVALVIDQHMPVGRGIDVPFFGRPASTTHAPALLSLASGAPILRATLERLPGGRHRAVIEPPLALERSGDRDADVVAITRALNTWLEERIRAHPDHWLWLHRRWKI